jgi:hypothetical protein
MTLGAIVRDLARPGVAEATLVEAGAMPLLARLEAAAADFAMPPGELANYISRTWLARAGDDDWLRLLGVMGKSDQPGLAALVMMLEQALAELDAKAAATTPEARIETPRS